MNPSSNKQISLRKWTRATFLGWLLGVALILILSSFLDSIGIEGMQFYLGIGMGGGVGLAQWLMLKKETDMSQNWIWFSVLGLGLPLVILDLLKIESAPYQIPLCMAIGALLTGLLQSLLLKRHSGKAAWWIPGCFLAWTLAIVTVFLIDYTKQLTPWISSNLILAFINLFLILAGGVVLGILSGISWNKIMEG